MRILIFSNWFPPVISGSSYYTSSLAQTLAARGHEVTVVTMDWGPDYRENTNLSFPIHHFPVIKIPALPVFYNLRLMGFGFTPGNIRRLKSLVDKVRPDILQHVNHIFDTTFLTARVARLANIPLIGSITTPIQHQNRFRQRVMACADRLTLGRFGVRKWDGVICLDREVYEYVKLQYGPETQRRSIIIPFGVRAESKALYQDAELERPGRPTILMVGHIHPFRNPVQLVRAMPLILKSVPQARLVLAGRVDIQQPMQVARALGLTSEQVEFRGQTAHDEVVQLMKTCHVFASWVTGPYHSLGTAPMEAMLCQMPVVNDLREDLFGGDALRNGENIVLVNSQEPQEIADAIVCLLRNEDLRRRIGAAGKRFVLEHLSWETIAQQTERFYNAVLAKKKGVIESTVESALNEGS
jgi:glycosyltransferase involved in cell wall biosynthesis